MFSIFSWFSNKKRSKEKLKNRLELVLAYDRAKISPGTVEALRNDLLEVVNRYFPSGNSQVDIDQDGDKVMLMASVAIDELGRSNVVAKDKATTDKANDKQEQKEIEKALDKLDPKTDKDKADNTEATSTATDGKDKPSSKK